MNSAMIFTSLAAGAAVLSLPGTLELAHLTLGSLLPARRREGKEDSPVRLAVVIPAHNEQEVIGNCLDSVISANPEQCPFDIFVVADNCTDATAEAARAKGVSVIERKDTTRRGKGYALDFAFNYLRRGYDAFVILDADSVVSPGFLGHFRSAFSRGAQALQCIYCVANPDASSATRLMDLSQRAFNQVRTRGRHGWGQSVGLLGNGFALSRQTLEKVPYLATSVVEDLEYHLALLRAGIRVELLRESVVAGLMPTGGKASSTQRARWEGGRFRMIREVAPGLMARVLSGRFDCLEPLAELLLLPLAFHTLLIGFAAGAGSGWPRILGLAGLAVLFLHLCAAIGMGNSLKRDLRAIATVPFYLLWKLTRLPMIVAASLRGAAWVRTSRSPQGVV